MEYEKKTCPRCGSELYADMSVCYGCLYDFERDASRREQALPEQGLAGSCPQATVPLGAAVDHGTSEVGVWLRTPSVDAWVALPSEGITLGRDPSNDVVLHSIAVSRRHLRLLPTPDGVEMTDLDATNPARYRGREVRGSIVAPYGDSIDLCGCVLTMTGPA